MLVYFACVEKCLLLKKAGYKTSVKALLNLDGRGIPVSIGVLYLHLILQLLFFRGQRKKIFLSFPNILICFTTCFQKKCRIVYLFH